MRWSWLVVSLGACYSPATERACEVSCASGGPCPSGLTCNADNLCANPDGTCDVREDGGTDGPTDGSTTCIGSMINPIRQCVPTPTEAVSFVGPTTINTTTDSRCFVFAQSGDPVDDLCVIAGTSITSSGVVTVIGARPLVLASLTTIKITGTLDASSRRLAMQTGAGGNHSDCPATTPPGDAGGGAGGTFQTAGGTGGSSDGAGGGVPATPSTQGVLVRGGCSGQDGENNATSARGDGGDGGGAIVLLAEQSIAIEGRLEVSGASGQGGSVLSGGGGGGSGGLLGLDAPSITMDANGKLIANGGGGGEGGSSGALGADGGESTNFDVAGAGGSSGTSGAGGNGAINSQTGGAGGSTAPMFGAGGGGGGVGYLLVFSNAATFPSGAISPPPIFPFQ